VVLSEAACDADACGMDQPTPAGGHRVPLGEAHLRELIGEYMAHYNVERPHQGLGGAFVQPSHDHTANGPLVRRARLGGLLNYYYREAA